MGAETMDLGPQMGNNAFVLWNLETLMDSIRYRFAECRWGLFSCGVAGLRLAALLFVLMEGVSRAAVQTESADMARLIDVIYEYEQSYWGTEITVRDDFLNPNNGHDDPVVSISRDGRSYAVELCVATDQAGKRVKTFNGYFSNQQYSIHITGRSQTPSTHIEMCWGAVGPENLAIKHVSISPLLGYLNMTGERFSTLCEMPGARRQIEQTRMFDTDVVALIVDAPKRTLTTFFFLQGQKPKLVGVARDVRPGDRIVHWEGARNFGTPPPQSWNVGDDSQYTNTRVVIGPIEYDRQGKPTRAVVLTTYERNGVPGSIRTTLEIASSRSLPAERTLDGVEFKNLSLPARVPVKVYGNGIAHELRNGRLVSVLDAQSIEVAAKVGFRRPDLWQQYRWYLLLILVIAVLSVVYYVHRRQR